MNDIYIIEAIPIARGVENETLTYYSQTKPETGAIIKIPLRRKSVSGLVVRVESTKNLKLEIRSAKFQLKRIEAVSSCRLIQEAAVNAARETAQHFAGSPGTVLNSVIPRAILESTPELQIPKKKNIDRSMTVTPKAVLQENDDDRFVHYRSLIRESFAKNESLFFCVPTAREVNKARNYLSRGIEKYTIAFHGYLSKKEIVSLWKKSLSSEHPILIIGTGIFLTIPRHDLKTIIIEQEHSSAYRTFSRPFFDYRIFAEKYAENIEAKIIFGDSLLRIETLWRSEEEHFTEISPLKFRSLNKVNQYIVDMRKSISKESRTFKIFSEELTEILSKTESEHRHTILFSTRRGLSPTTVCGDCGSIVKCKSCHASVILHRGNLESGGNFFLCHSCGERRSAAEKCVVCGNWKLIPLGIGSELIEDEIKKIFPKLSVSRIDSDTATTQKKAEQIVTKFQNSPSGVLIGTEAMFFTGIKPVDNVCIVSLDALFSIPDFRIHEKIIHFIMSLRDLSLNTFILQTRNPDEAVLRDAYAGHLADFYHREIKMRRHLSYPPFSVLIKITAEGDKDDISKIMETIRTDISPYDLSVFPAFIKTSRNKHALHGIIKVPYGKWVDEKLLRVIKKLPASILICVNPESVL